jgi:2-hydroxychromene-2-carboxylate isomerase
VPKLDYYFATISPFTYLAGTRLTDIAARHGLKVVYKPLDIMGLFGRTGGIPPKDRHPNRQAYRLQDLERAAKKVGLPLNLKPMFWPTNPAPASYAIIAAQNAVAKGASGNLDALVHGIGRRCWADDKNIAETDVIAEALVEAGFDADLTDSGLLEGAETYAANLEEAVARGVFGAPFYITEDDQRFWGQDKLDDLDLTLQGKL